MEVEQQGLYLMTIICSLISLLSCCFILMTCGITSIWRRSSIRMIMYLTLSNIATGIIMLLPTYKYEFLCSVQTHLLHFSIISQVIWSSLFLHFAYFKTVQEKTFSQKIELVYVGLAFLPALITSIPPFVSEYVANNCWSENHSPLQDAISSFGFLTIYIVSVLFSFSFYMGMMVNLSLFPKGYYSDEFDSKLEKLRMTGKFTLMYHGLGMVLFIYATLQLVDRHKRGMDFIAMFCQASCGTMTLILFVSCDKVRKGMKVFFADKEKFVEVEESHTEITF
jgi:hypothetical protein